ncbi:uncharacterized protein AMSG_07799 [Thecamonas trahens ATCC 50062]|uniref:Protein transport protein SEC23 n=1 Tax=Thecamonas trahens ATCC 50062 TaxID=461836 RepID=A0A0L0DHN2_THETB|nr:hypothetical protein AMSG_07799 [Thecamonas trahens ATCC 50062]KNC51730.1 hypothetical protein AMSG_07799 [Thecamonas trahens ATCC 50062]|eukprot:XP_013755859.1 hypothetical protein AMSG_07799 [Thecamonas trahens ATCC 50062]
MAATALTNIYPTSYPVGHFYCVCCGNSSPGAPPLLDAPSKRVRYPLPPAESAPGDSADVRLGLAHSLPPLLVVVYHTAAGSDAAAAVRAALGAALADTVAAGLGSLRVAMIAVGGAVTVYDLHLDDVVHGRVVAGARALGETTRAGLAANAAQSCVDAALPATAVAVDAVVASWTGAPSAPGGQLALAVALDAALELCAAHGSTAGGSVLLVTAAHPNYGPGATVPAPSSAAESLLNTEALGVLDDLAARAYELDVAIDAVVTSALGNRVVTPALVALARSTGGALACDLGVLPQMVLDRSACLAARALAAAPRVIELTLPRGLEVAHVLGPVVELEPGLDELGSVRITTAPLSADAGLTVVLAHEGEVKPGRVYFQVRVFEPDAVTVVTRPLQVVPAPDADAALAAVDPRALAVVEVKQIVADVLRQLEDDLKLGVADGRSAGREALEQRLRALAGAAADAGRANTAEQALDRLPFELRTMARLLYAAWRGPIFGVGSPFDTLDAWSLAATSLVDAAYPLAARMVEPQLATVLPRADGSAVPLALTRLSSLSLASDSVLVYDAGLMMVVWIGTQGGSPDDALLYAQQLAGARTIPLPVAVVDQRLPGARDILAPLLEPCHLDASNVQLYDDPVLADLPENELSARRSAARARKTPPDATFRSWIRRVLST